MDIDHFFILLAALNNLQATGHCKVKTMDVENNHWHDFEPRKNEFACLACTEMICTFQNEKMSLCK